MDLLNYTIDIQHLKLFFKLLKAIGNFYSICNIPEIALKFYRQLKLAAILQKNDEYVTYALIGLGSCCESSNLFE